MAIKIKNGQQLRQVLAEHGVSVGNWPARNIELLWQEINSQEAQLVESGGRLFREVWVATIDLYHFSPPAWLRLLSNRDHGVSVSGKYGHLGNKVSQESPLIGVLREMKEELGFGDLRLSQSLEDKGEDTKLKPATSTGKYPQLGSIIHLKRYAGIINPKDYRSAGYTNRLGPGFTERFWWEYCDTPEIFKNQFF